MTTAAFIFPPTDPLGWIAVGMAASVILDALLSLRLESGRQGPQELRDDSGMAEQAAALMATMADATRSLYATYPRWRMWARLQAWCAAAFMDRMANGFRAQAERATADTGTTDGQGTEVGHG